MGAINGGLGNTHVNHVLTALNIPFFNSNTFQTHEKEIGRGMEEMAVESCKALALEERRLTIENVEEVTKLFKFIF
ncbi:uncharacterized protein LOC122511917 isoform X2 [Leptopilina heterotoma]|uniref:uncharacterized protein LOC122511917 isoform X2 n=1 Tax=Leptopilina heterotoma TaxID=63436 RepID=UPI001CA8E84E|nr:uncharacterized protein LOC122511917 isoform X2 [Leptopilina heterotoma]